MNSMPEFGQKKRKKVTKSQADWANTQIFQLASLNYTRMMAENPGTVDEKKV
jgi:hypothetical protein